MSWLYSVRFHLGLAIALCIGGTGLCWWFLTGHQHTWLTWLANWLLVVNLIAFIYYGIDKLLAARGFAVRVPEAVLHSLAALGGSPAAFLAMWLFRHKTIKPSFRILFWGIVVLQIALVAFIIVKLLERP